MPSIKAITQASGYMAAYAAENKEDDRLEPVVCWSVIEFDAEDEPDEVVGQIFDGTCITEATSVDEEEGYGEFVGYFRDRADALEACENHRAMRGAKSPKKDDEDREEDPEDEEESEENEEIEEDDFSSWDDDE